MSCKIRAEWQISSWYAERKADSVSFSLKKQQLKNKACDRSPVIGLVCPLGRFPLAVMSRKELVNIYVPCVFAHYISREPHSTGYAVLPLPLWETLRFSSFEWGISYRCPGLLYTGLSSCQSTSLHMGKGRKSDFEMALHSHNILICFSLCNFTGSSYVWHLSSQHDPKPLSLVCQPLTETLIQHVTPERSQQMNGAIQHKYSK